MTSSMPISSVSFPPGFDAWRVADERFARAYSRAGDRGRAYVKSCIAALFRRAQGGTALSTSRAASYPDGLSRVEELRTRPWFVLAVSPEVLSPSMLVAAVLPAVAARIPLVVAVRVGARGWPDAQLAALELCGVEQAYALPMEQFRQCLNVLHGEHGPGGLAVLGPESFQGRLAGAAPGACFAHGLVPPSMGLLEDPSAEWDREALDFCLAGAVLQVHATPDSLARAGHGAVFSPPALAPSDAGLVVGPGREFLWDWPDMPLELFFARRLVYS